MQMDDLVLLEYDKRRKQLESTINLKEEELKEKENFISNLEAKKKNKYFGRYFVEKKYNGTNLFLHKKGLEVKIFSGKDNVTADFSELVSDVVKLANADFVLKGVFVSLDNDSVFYITDCLYYGRGLEQIPLFERKRILKSLNFSDKIKESGYVEINNREDAKKAIELFSGLSEIKGAIVRKFDSKYFFETDFLEYLSVLKFNVLVLRVDKSNKNPDFRKYFVGVTISENTDEKFSSKSVVLFEGKLYYGLGETNETIVSAERGDCLMIRTDNVLKSCIASGLVQYSLRNPFVLEKVKDGGVISLSELELSLEEVD